MSVFSGPEIPNNGLVFYYDMSNTQKSWKGKPLTNYYGNISTSAALRGFRTQHFWNGYQWTVNGTYSHPGVDGPAGVYLGLVYKHTSGALSDSWSGNSYGYVLKDIASTIGATYTMSSWVYVSSGSNLTGVLSVTEGATTNNIFVSGFPTAYNMSNLGTWQQLAVSAVSDGNIRWLPNYPRREGVADGSFSGFYMWGGVQVEDGSTVNRYAGVDTSYARSNTQALLDLTNQETITAASLTYPSNGQFTFDGVNNYMTIPQPNVTLSPNRWSIEMVIYPSSADFIAISPNSAGIDHFVRYDGAGQRINFRITETADINNRERYSSVNSVPLNTFTHVMLTINNLTMKIYINGVLDSSYTETIAIADWAGDWHIGQRQNGTFRMNGSLPLLKIYNRELTATEVAQNFVATRSRYNI